MIGSIVLAIVAISPQRFADVPLDTALTRAVATSPDVAQARDRVAEDAALLAAARATDAPALTANYAMSPQAGTTNATVLQQLTTVGGHVSLGRYFTYAPAVRQAEFNLSAARFALLDAQRSERIKVSGQYFDALRGAANLTVRERALAGARADLRAARIRFKAGDVPRLDIVRAQVAVAGAAAALDAARVALLNAQQALSVETGEPLDRFDRLAPQPVEMPAATGAANAVALALAQRSDLAAAQRNVDAESAAIAVAQRAELPAMTLDAGYTTGVDTGIHVSGPSANLTFAFPLAHEAADRVRAERARLAAAQDAARSIRRHIEVEVAAAARTYAETASAAAAATRARISAQEELRATEIGYRSGASSSLDVATARLTYVQAALDEISAMYAQAQAAATLQQETGP